MFICFLFCLYKQQRHRAIPRWIFEIRWWKYYFLYTPLSVKLKEKDWECFKTYRMQNTVPSDGRKFRDRKRDEGFWYWEPSKNCQNKSTKLTKIILKTRSCWQCCGSGRILSGSDLEVRIQIIKTEFVLLKFRLFC